MDSAAPFGPFVYLLLTVCAGCVPLTSEVADPIRLPVSAADEAPPQLVAQLAFTAEASEPDPRADEAYTLDEIVGMAGSTHPRVVAAGRSVKQARAEVDVAKLRSNPDLVLDVDTPVNGNNDRTEISGRVTFPIGPANRNARIRVVHAKSTTAYARYRDTQRQVQQAAYDAAINVLYLQERLDLEEASERIARQRATLLLPESLEGDAADNLTASLNARTQADRAAESLLQTRRELALARLQLGESMGIDLSRSPTLAETIQIRDSFAVVLPDLPSVQQAIARTLNDSTRLRALRGEVQESWLRYQAERDRTLPWEIGPRYENQLGDDGDTVGVRFRTELALHQDHQRTRARAAAQEANVRAALVEQSRNEIARQVAGDLYELKLITERLDGLRDDRFIEDQQNRLDDPIATSSMTGQQILRVEEAILERKKTRLELEYRFKQLHSQLGLPAAGNARSANHKLDSLTGNRMH